MECFIKFVAYTLLIATILVAILQVLASIIVTHIVEGIF